MRDLGATHADAIAQKPANLAGSTGSLPYPGELPTTYSCAESLFSILQLVRYHLLLSFKWKSQVDTAALWCVLALFHLSTGSGAGSPFHYTPCHSFDPCFI